MSLNRLLRTKPAQTLIDEAYEPGHQLKKSLTAFDLVAFGVGATIGSGIFALTGTAAAGQAAATVHDWLSTPIINFLLEAPLGREGAGPAVSIAFMIAAIACAFAALCYAELAAMIPVSGSAYTFAYAALGEFVAWIIGWDLILEYAVGNVAVAVSWSDYFLHLLHFLGFKLPLWLAADTTTALTRIASAGEPHSQAALYSSLQLPMLFGHPFAINLPAFAIVGLITWVLIVGIKESAWINTLMVLIKVGIVLFFVAYGFGYVNTNNWVPFAPGGLAGILGASAIVFFSFIGFDAVSSTAEEAKNPQRDMPIGMLGSLAICTVLYAAVSLILTGLLPYKSYADDAAPVATALMHTGNPWAQLIVTVGALAGMTSVLLVFQLGQPRIFMAMARDGLLPQFFARVHPKFQTPFIPTLITGVIVGLSAFFLDIGQAAELTNIGTLAAFILVCGGVIMLRKLEPTRQRPFKCPLVPIVPILGIVSCFGLMLSLPAVTWLRFFIWMAIGIVIYFLYGYRHSELHRVEVVAKELDSSESK